MCTCCTHTPVCAQVYVQMQLHAEACGQQQVSPSISLYLLRWVSHLPWSSPSEELSIRPHRSCCLHSASVCSFLYGCQGSEHRFFCLPSTSLAEPSPQPQVNISYIRPVATAGPEGRQHTMKTWCVKGLFAHCMSLFSGRGSQNTPSFELPLGDSLLFHG